MDVYGLCIIVNICFQWNSSCDVRVSLATKCGCFGIFDRTSWTTSIDMIDWLVVWNIYFIFPYIGNFIIPTDELICFRGVGQSPTSWYDWLQKQQTQTQHRSLPYHPESSPSDISVASWELGFFHHTPQRSSGDCGWENHGKPHRM